LTFVAVNVDLLPGFGRPAGCGRQGAALVA
jgi:hypothetical protein